MNRNNFPLAVAIGTTRFLWLLAGPQAECAANDKKFNEVSQTEKEQPQ